MQHFIRICVSLGMERFDTPLDMSVISNKSRVEDLAMKVGHLERQMDTLQLTCQAMWEVLKVLLFLS